MPVISGTLKDGAGQPIAGCTIQLRALNTTSVVIRTTTARVGANTGAYRIDAQPGRYEVVLAIDDYPPQKVGIIDVYADSLDGTLNDYLTVVSGDYLIPDAMKQFEQLTQQAKASAWQAETSAKGLEQLREDVLAAKDVVVQSQKDAIDQARLAGQSALSASRSATDAGDSARQSAAGAVASEDSSKASAMSAKAAAVSEKNATTSEKNAGTSERNAKASEDAAAQSVAIMTEQVSLAQNAAKTAATDAVAVVVPEVTRQIKDDISADVNRAEAAASAAETSKQDAQQALKAAQDIAKTPGPSAYDVWKSQQPDSTDTTMAAYLNTMKGKDTIIPRPGEVGSYVLALAQGGGAGFGGEIEGEYLKPTAFLGGDFWIEEGVSLAGTWAAVGYFSDTGPQRTLFLRIR
ncbi:hypothetical protein FOK89_11020 [Salmonella enterica]|nr:hypothetical protein [Salmonella enterica]